MFPPYNIQESMLLEMTALRPWWRGYLLDQNLYVYHIFGDLCAFRQQ